MILIYTDIQTGRNKTAPLKFAVEWRELCHTLTDIKIILPVEKVENRLRIDQDFVKIFAEPFCIICDNFAFHKVV